jgi:hypothetical protein
LQRAFILQAQLNLQNLRDETLDRIFFLYDGYEGFANAVRCLKPGECGSPGDGSISAILAPISPVGGSSGRLAQAGFGVADDLAGARQALLATLEVRAAGLSKVLVLSASSGSKISQQIARFRASGGTGGVKEFLKFANDLATRARSAGTFVSGRVGRGPNSIANATIFRNGNAFIVVDEVGVIRSFVPNATPGEGIVLEFLRLGGSL